MDATSSGITVRKTIMRLQHNHKPSHSCQGSLAIVHSCGGCTSNPSNVFSCFTHHLCSTWAPSSCTQSSSAIDRLAAYTAHDDFEAQAHEVLNQAQRCLESHHIPDSRANMSHAFNEYAAAAHSSHPADAPIHTARVASALIALRSAASASASPQAAAAALSAAAAAAQPAAGALLSAAEEACQDAVWHGAAVAAFADAQVLLLHGLPPFWEGLLTASHAIREATSDELPTISSAAASLRVHSRALWSHIAGAADDLAFQMSPVGLLATLRALASPPAGPLPHSVPTLAAAAAFDITEHAAQDAPGTSRFVTDMAVAVSSLMSQHQNGSAVHLQLTQRETAGAILEASRSVQSTYDLQGAVKALSAVSALLLGLEADCSHGSSRGSSSGEFRSSQAIQPKHLFHLLL